MIRTDAFNNQKEVFQAAGTTPKTAVLMHVNDTFGLAMLQGIKAMMPKFDMPFTFAEEIAYDPAAKRPVGRGRQGQGDRAESAAGGVPAQRCHPADARDGQAALEPDGHYEPGRRAGTRTTISRRWASSPTVR